MEGPPRVPIKASIKIGFILKQTLLSTMGGASPGLIPSIPKKNLEEKIIDVAEVNQLRYLEESRQ